MEKHLSRQDLSDILTGCAVLGTGGGGDVAEGQAYLDYALNNGKTFRLVDIDEAPQDAFVCTPYLLGALVDAEPLVHGATPDWPIFTAFERLQKYTQVPFYGTICCELGGANTAISFMLAAMIDGYIIDADPTGRAVPEITHSTYYLNGLPASPIVSANAAGEVFICENIESDKRSETVMRVLCSISDDSISVIDHAMPISQIKHAVIPGTISKAMRIGRFLRENRHKGKQALVELAAIEGGKIIFEGIAKHAVFNNVEGFTLGSITIADGDDILEIRVKNENMSCLLNDELLATIPDLICCFDSNTLEPITNPNIHKGMQVIVMLLPANSAFLSKQGLAIFGPKYAGFDSPFRSIVSNVKGN